MSPGREGKTSPGWRKEKRVQVIPGFPALRPLQLRKHLISKTSRRTRAWPTLPGSRGANPDVRPKFQQPVAIAYVSCHSLLLLLIPFCRLVAGSAPMQL